MAKQRKILVYAKYIPKVGGIETITFNLCKMLSQNGYDVTLVFDNAETSESLLKFAPYVDVKKLQQDETITGDICILASNHKIPKNVKAKRYIQWIHSDYKKYNITLANQGENIEYVAVTQHCADVAKELYGIEATAIMNFPDPDFGKTEKETLKLCTVTRLSPEKGLSRMVWLARKFKELKKPFVWLIIGDNSACKAEEQKWRNAFKDIEEVSFLGYKSDPSYYMKWADFTVLLSDFEGCPMAIAESLSEHIQTPVLTTDWGGSEEVLKLGKMPPTGWRLPMKIEDTDDDFLQVITSAIPCNIHYDFETEKKKWIKLLEKKE